MITTKDEYHKRKSEVEKYLEATSLLDKGNCEIVCTDILGTHHTLNIDSELSLILKANTFLLLYNLVESTISNSIKAVINAVVDEHLTYEQLSENIKKLWIKHVVHDVKDIHKFEGKIHELAQKLIDRELLILSHECINISGNIDAQKIRKIADQIGWEISSDGRELQTIKDKRNHLAHGEYTFVEIGKNLTINELKEIKDKTFIYLEDVLTKVKGFIDEKKYLIK